MYDLRVIVAVVVSYTQLDIRTCTAQIVHKLYLQRFDDAVITFIGQEKCHHYSKLEIIYPGSPIPLTTLVEIGCWPKSGVVGQYQI